MQCTVFVYIADYKIDYVLFLYLTSHNNPDVLSELFVTVEDTEYSEPSIIGIVRTLTIY